MNLRNGNITLTEENGFSCFEVLEIAREMHFCFMNVQANHD